MKIISKFKDYYDYLQGIYGVDERLILDRVQYSPMKYTPGDSVETLYIGDYVIQGLWREGKIYWAEDIIPFAREKSIEKGDYYSIPDGKYQSKQVLKAPKRLDNSVTYREDCPILRLIGHDYEHNPILSQYNVQRILSPEKTWQILSEWLGTRITRNEPEVPIGDDKTRILSHGFDLKQSFRHRK